MNAIPEMPYLAAEGFSRPIPLERFLPDCPVGVVSQHLADSKGQDGWILDPFGSNPLLDIEAAAGGRRVLVSSNNPILAFLLRMLAQPRMKNDFLSALAELASQQRGTERLETHIKNLYTTRCTVCHNLIQAGGYVWQRGMDHPLARLYRCPICGDEGEHPLGDEDLEIFEPLKRGEKLPYARAVGRVIGGSNEDRPAVEEALKLYNARSLYVLFTLLNKLDGMVLASAKRELLEAMMISGLEAGTSLWPWPNTGDPPRMLNVPAVYLEKNIWNEIEHSILLWTQPAPPVKFTHWPELPQGAGICLFPGPIRDLVLPADIRVDEILALPPRPNQALWTLSALWSAWLWGRESETKFSQVLGRRRFDWHWHTHALHHAFHQAHVLAGEKIDMFMIIGEPSPGMALATSTAVNCAGYSLMGMAYQGSNDPVEMSWHASGEINETGSANVQSIARSAIQDLLDRLGEPAEYLTLFSAIIASLAVNNGLPRVIGSYTQEKSSELQGIIARLFNDREFLRRFDATSQELDSGKWGLVNAAAACEPLADRVECAVLNGLKESGSVTAAEMQHRLAQELPGFLTPPHALVEFCLRAYAEWQRENDAWVLKVTEKPGEREKDMTEIAGLLHELAGKLGYTTNGDAPMVWSSMKNLPSFRFWIADTACLAPVCKPKEVPAEDVFVFPGSRAELLQYKLLRDPQLREKTAAHWHFLKFRALRSLAARSDLSTEIWQMMLDSDPISLEETMQLRMFS